MKIGQNGLEHGCNNICNEIDIPEITNDNVLFKRQIKSTIQKNITEQNINNMLSLKKKVADNIYLHRMGLNHSRIWIRYKARAIKGIKDNHKRIWKNDLECRFWDDKMLDTLEHHGKGGT